jgi:hypothetical protein
MRSHKNHNKRELRTQLAPEENETADFSVPRWSISDRKKPVKGLTGYQTNIRSNLFLKEFFVLAYQLS